VSSDDSQFHFSRWFNQQDAFMLAQNTAGNAVFEMSWGGGGGQNAQLYSPAPVAYGSGWHHLVGVYDGPAMMMYLYVDGVRVNALATTFSAFFAIQAPIRVSGTGGTLFPSHAVLDDARLYDRALSDAEVLALYNCAP